MDATLETIVPDPHNPMQGMGDNTIETRIMSERDYRKLTDFTDDQIAIDATLLFPYDNIHKGTSVDILQSGMRRFCPPGLRCCFAVWRTDLCTMVYFPEAQSHPTKEQLIAAFYMCFVLEHYEENQKGNWLWA